MSQELLYTSAPKGLKSGSHGFCMVLCSEGMPAPLATALEGLSAYKPVYPVGDPSEARNPVTAMHVILPAIGRKQHVLSRVASFGLDYSGRPNKLAHHVVLDARDLAPAGPAWMLAQPGVMKSDWSGEPKVVAANRQLAKGDVQPAPCRNWARVTGDAGWGGVLAESLMKDPARLAYLIIEPGLDVLPLFAEAIALLPPDRRWQATFSTYFTTLPAGATCNWRCLLADSPLVHQSKRHVHALRLDLTRPLGKAPDGEWVEFARTGKRPRVVETARPVPAASAAVASLNDAEIGSYGLAEPEWSSTTPPGRRGRPVRKSVMPKVFAVVALTLVAAAGIWGSVHFRREGVVVAKDEAVAATEPPEEVGAKPATAMEGTISDPEPTQTSGPPARNAEEPPIEPSDPVLASARSESEKPSEPPLPPIKIPIPTQHYVADLPKQRALDQMELVQDWSITPLDLEGMKIDLFAGEQSSMRISLLSHIGAVPARFGFIPGATQDAQDFAEFDLRVEGRDVRGVALKISRDLVEKVSVLDGCAVRLRNDAGQKAVLLLKMPSSDAQRPNGSSDCRSLSETVSLPRSWRFAGHAKEIRLGLPFGGGQHAAKATEVVIRDLTLKVGEELLQYIPQDAMSARGEAGRSGTSAQSAWVFEAADGKDILQNCETLASSPSIVDGATSIKSLLPTIAVEMASDEAKIRIDSKRLTKTFTDQATARLKTISHGQSNLANGAIVLTKNGRETAGKQLVMLRERKNAMSLPGSGAAPAAVVSIQNTIDAGEKLIADGELVERTIERFENAEIVSLKISLRLKHLAQSTSELEIPLVSVTTEESQAHKE